MDYYEILGLPKNATEDEIKKSYRKLAMKHHPDRNAGNKKSEDEFKKINTAYSILSDPIKRENYDLQNSIGKNGAFSQSSSFNNNEDISDFMKNVFGNRNPFNEFFEEQFHHRRPTRKTYNIHLNFWEAAFGVQKEFEIIDDNGNRKSFNISFPAGLDNGITLEVGMSNHPPLYLHIHVEPDAYFTRDNLDLHTTIELPMSKAVLGGVMKFPHWNHDYEVTIPPGTQHGQTLRLSNAGIKKDIFVGDLYLKCKIIMPKKLNKKQTELMEAFAKTEKENPSIFDNLKSSWNKFFKKDTYEQ